MIPEELEVINKKVGFTLDNPAGVNFKKIIIQRDHDFFYYNQDQLQDAEALEINFYEDVSFWRLNLSKLGHYQEVLGDLMNRASQTRFLRLVFIDVELYDNFEELQKNICLLLRMKNLVQVQGFLIITNGFTDTSQKFLSIFASLTQSKKVVLKRVNLEAIVLGMNGFDQKTKRNFEKMTYLESKLCREKVNCYSSMLQWTTLSLTTQEITYYHQQKKSKLKYPQNAWMLPSISNIRFPFLKKIKFLYSRLESIQPLARLGAPSLEHIELAFNQIISVRSLARLQSPRIKTMKIHYNQIRELAALAEADMPQFRQLIFGARNFAHDPWKIQYGKIDNLSVLGKLNTKYQIRLWYLHNRFKRLCKRKMRAGLKYKVYETDDTQEILYGLIQIEQLR